jgi:hypothetical protein
MNQVAQTTCFCFASRARKGSLIASRDGCQRRVIEVNTHLGIYAHPTPTTRKSCRPTTLRRPPGIPPRRRRGRLLPPLRQRSTLRRPVRAPPPSLLSRRRNPAPPADEETIGCRRRGRGGQGPGRRYPAPPPPLAASGPRHDNVNTAARAPPPDAEPTDRRCRPTGRSTQSPVPAIWAVTSCPKSKDPI